ncbi:hypothetical protein P2318_03305 [Myxococcaceae bacterium GXIMD 01537]
MTHARDEFEAWREHKLAGLRRERDEALRSREALLKQAPAPRSAGEEGEAVARSLEDFMRRQRWVEGTLEMVRRVVNEGAYHDEVLYGIRADGHPDTFPRFTSEPLWDLGRELVDAQDGAAELTVRLNLSTGEREVTLLSGASLRRKTEQAALDEAVTKLDAKVRRLEELELSTEPFGVDLARRVARALKKYALHHGHRDYCGMGLFGTEDGGFVYTSVYDGGFIDADVVKRFKDEEQLIAWLAAQSDASLSNYGGEDFSFRNQTLDRARLEDFARG